MTTQIAFEVDTGRVLEILSKQIYDSPFAMVRENLQNAYDAVLMRATLEGKPVSAYSITVTVSARRVQIVDHGVGMTEKVLRENFWRAGSSGKNTPEARAAGVIGTFGIGAMANFGVCDQLIVETRPVGAAKGIRTTARKADLSIGTDCITLEIVDSGIEEGTRITADIAPSVQLDIEGLRNYILPYVRFLQVPITLNGESLSGHDPREAAGIGGSWREVSTQQIISGRYKLDLAVVADGASVGVIATNLHIDDVPRHGGMWLRHGGGQISGLRSRFGLAPLPVPSTYQLGGFADLPFLVPTAGREALTRESVQEAAQLVPSIETAISESIRDTELADRLPAFQQHLLQLNQTVWAHRVAIQLSPGDRRIELGQIEQQYPGAKLLWYAGADAGTIINFSSEDRPLIRVSQQRPRRDLQQRYLTQVLQLNNVPDSASILERYETSQLEWSEVKLMFALARVLRGDYLIENVEIEWVKISHGVSMLTETVNDKLILRLSRVWPALQALLKAIEGSPDLIDGLTKDLVRVHIYDKIKGFVPSSQRTGLDALQKTLAKRRELYRLELDDTGSIEPLLADYLSGKLDFPGVLSAAVRATSAQTQRVSHESIGSVEKVLVDVVNTPGQIVAARSVTTPEVGSPIMRPDMLVKERLLITENEFPHLNNYKLFLALSDRLFELEREFFIWPHSTQVAWAGKRIVYLFGLPQSGQSLYYDVELKGDRSAGDAGGTAIATTTIVGKNRIFVPVPPQLAECFAITNAPIEFYVRFDVISSSVRGPN